MGTWASHTAGQAELGTPPFSATAHTRVAGDTARDPSELKTDRSSSPAPQDRAEAGTGRAGRGARGAHSLRLLALVVRASPGVAPRLPLGQRQVWQEGGQRALYLVRLPAQGVLRGAVIGALPVEADVVGWAGGHGCYGGPSEQRRPCRPPRASAGQAMSPCPVCWQAEFTFHLHQALGPPTTGNGGPEGELTCPRPHGVVSDLGSDPTSFLLTLKIRGSLGILRSVFEGFKMAFMLSRK